MTGGSSPPVCIEVKSQPVKSAPVQSDHDICRPAMGSPLKLAPCRCEPATLQLPNEPPATCRKSQPDRLLPERSALVTSTPAKVIPFASRLTCTQSRMLARSRPLAVKRAACAAWTSRLRHSQS